MIIWSLESTWELVLPPSRPCENQLKIINGYISKLNPKKICVAILGSTPEFRDLIFELGIKNTYVFDKSSDFYEKMSTQRVYNNQEQYINGDWLYTLRNYKNYFDVVLSDLTAGNIDYSNREIFYNLIKDCLKSEGLFIDKYLSNKYGLISLAEIREKYSKKPINLRTVNDFSCEAIFCSELQSQTGIIDTTKIYSQLSSAFHDNKRLLKFIELSHYITPNDCVWYYGDSRIKYINGLELISKTTLYKTAYENRAWIYVWKKNK